MDKLFEAVALPRLAAPAETAESHSSLSSVPVTPAPRASASEAPAADETAVIVVLHGERIAQLPKNLYIPPNALAVAFESFEGPLDVLLHLVRKKNIDVLDIPVAVITQQYLRDLELMQALSVEWVADYLVMAATLVEMKSRALLPVPSAEEAEDQEEDMRSELVRRFQEYACIKQVAEHLDHVARVDRDIFIAGAMIPPCAPRQIAWPAVTVSDITTAQQHVLSRVALSVRYPVPPELLSVRERMQVMASRLQVELAETAALTAFLSKEEGRMGVAVTVLAVLEWVRQGMMEYVQTEAYGSVYLRWIAQDSRVES